MFQEVFCLQEHLTGNHFVKFSGQTPSEMKDELSYISPDGRRFIVMRVFAIIF